MMRWRGTAESVAYGAFSMRNGAVTVSNTAGLLSASIRSLMAKSRAGVRETAKRTPPSYRLRALIYIDGKNSLRLRAYNESGSQIVFIRKSATLWLTPSTLPLPARYPQFLHIFPDDSVLPFRSRRVVADASASPLRCPFA